MKDGHITCRLTGSIGKGIEAHIIPESFYLFSKENRKPTNILELKGERQNQRSKKGFFDSSIVTIEGEKHFSDCDRYANELLIKRDKEAKAYASGTELMGLELFEYNYRLLKLFALSLLWRAHVTSNRFFKDVDVGARHESKLRSSILENNPGSLNDYTVLFAFYEDIPNTGFGLMSPWSERREKVRFYQFQLAYWIMFIKVDQQPCPEPLRGFALSEDQPFRAINLGHYSKSKTFRKLILPALLKMEP